MATQRRMGSLLKGAATFTGSGENWDGLYVTPGNTTGDPEIDPEIQVDLQAILEACKVYPEVQYLFVNYPHRITTEEHYWEYQQINTMGEMNEGNSFDFLNLASFAFRHFQILRTVLVVLGGFVFDVAPNLTQSFTSFYRLFADHSISTAWNQIKTLGLEIRHYGMISVGMMIILLVDVYHEYYGSNTIRRKLDTKPFVIRYLLILACLLVTLYYGVWGPSFGASAFVYMQF